MAPEREPPGIPFENQTRIVDKIKDLAATSCRIPIRHPAWERLGFYLIDYSCLVLRVFVGEGMCALVENGLCSIRLDRLSAGGYSLPHMSVLEFDNYRLYLRSVLADRASTNPRYSLRAFAKSLELAPSYLSAVMNGKKSLSPETAYAVAEKLRLDEQEATYFRILAQMEATKNPALKESLLQRAQTLAPSVVVNDLSVDQFKMISDWHHYAIFAAVDLSDIEATPERIAKILGLNLAEVQVAVERMIRLEMLEKDAEGRLKQTISHSRIVSLAPNRAVRSHHRQNLEKAIESIGLQRPDERFMGSETFCIDESQFEEFQKLCNQFLDSALALAKKAKTKNQVYHLGVQFFRFSQEKPKEEKK